MGGNITKVESENQISSTVVYTSGDSKSYLNYKERQAISDSWNYISKNKLKYGTILFLRLFEVQPAVKDLFTIFDFNEPLEDIVNSSHFRSHAMRFMQSLETGVLLGFEKESCAFLYKSIGGRHINYDLKSEFLSAIPECLLYTLEKACDSNWNDEAANAWKHAILILCNLFREGLESK